MKLETLAYVSRATPGLGLRDLKHVLRRSREHNFRARVTGYLVYDGVWFAQLLEGPAASLDAALARIMADPRHGEIRLLVRQPIVQRCFDGWAMGCTNLTAPVHIDTSELRGLIHDFVDGRRLDLPEVQAFFRSFVEFRTPEETALLSL